MNLAGKDVFSVVLSTFTYACTVICLVSIIIEKSFRTKPHINSYYNTILVFQY